MCLSSHRHTALSLVWPAMPCVSVFLPTDTPPCPWCGPPCLVSQSSFPQTHRPVPGVARHALCLSLPSHRHTALSLVWPAMPCVSVFLPTDTPPCPWCGPPCLVSQSSFPQTHRPVPGVARHALCLSLPSHRHTALSLVWPAMPCVSVFLPTDTPPCPWCGPPCLVSQSSHRHTTLSLVWPAMPCVSVFPQTHHPVPGVARHALCLSLPTDTPPCPWCGPPCLVSQSSHRHTALSLVWPAMPCVSVFTALSLVWPAMPCVSVYTALSLVWPAMPCVSVYTALSLVWPAMPCVSVYTTLSVVWPGMPCVSVYTTLSVVWPAMPCVSVYTTLSVVWPGMPCVSVYTALSVVWPAMPCVSVYTTLSVVWPAMPCVSVFLPTDTPPCPWCGPAYLASQSSHRHHPVPGVSVFLPTDTTLSLVSQSSFPQTPPCPWCLSLPSHRHHPVPGVARPSMWLACIQGTVECCTHASKARKLR